jgi:hypothetical protein
MDWRVIRISDVVWSAMKKDSTLEDTPDKVLQRWAERLNLVDQQLTGLVGNKRTRSAPKGSMPIRWSLDRKRNILTGAFRDGTSEEFALPAKDDYAGIKKVREQVVRFVEAHGGSDGQWRAGHKELSGHGWRTRR